MVSPKGDIVGDAKYFTLVHGQRLPPAKFSVIAEHVWLLEKTGAPTSFWSLATTGRCRSCGCERYGGLLSGVEFYFLADWGDLERLSTGTSD